MTTAPWQEALALWMSYNQHSYLVHPYKALPQHVIKARMLRTVSMPHDEPAGLWYRNTVCSLERLGPAGAASGTWRWYGTTSLAAACAHARSETVDNFRQFLLSIHAAHFEQTGDMFASQQALIFAMELE